MIMNKDIDLNMDNKCENCGGKGDIELPPYYAKQDVINSMCKKRNFVQLFDRPRTIRCLVCSGTGHIEEQPFEWE